MMDWMDPGPVRLFGLSPVAADDKQQIEHVHVFIRTSSIRGFRTAGSNRVYRLLPNTAVAISKPLPILP